ncbi:hypothetical protein C8R43DRAFT_1200564 [Mycena crocata]|nr:hypothetical protein C8R43DRAFT_1200564 [Mycena crocata]
MPEIIAGTTESGDYVLQTKFGLGQEPSKRIATALCKLVSEPRWSVENQAGKQIGRYRWHDPDLMRARMYLAVVPNQEEIEMQLSPHGYVCYDYLKSPIFWIPFGKDWVLLWRGICVASVNPHTVARVNPDTDTGTVNLRMPEDPDAISQDSDAIPEDPEATPENPDAITKDSNAICPIAAGFIDPDAFLGGGGSYIDWERGSVSIREARAWICGWYSSLGSGTVDKILRIANPERRRIFAALRLVFHALQGRGLERSLAFVEAPVPMSPSTNNTNMNTNTSALPFNPFLPTPAPSPEPRARLPLPPRKPTSPTNKMDAYHGSTSTSKFNTSSPASSVPGSTSASASICRLCTRDSELRLRLVGSDFEPINQSKFDLWTPTYTLQFFPR